MPQSNDRATINENTRGAAWDGKATRPDRRHLGCRAWIERLLTFGNRPLSDTGLLGLPSFRGRFYREPGPTPPRRWPETPASR